MKAFTAGAAKSTTNTTSLSPPVPPAPNQDTDSSTDGTPTSSDSKGAADGTKSQAKLAQRFKGSLNSPADLLAFKVEVVTSTAKNIKGEALAWAFVLYQNWRSTALANMRSIAVPVPPEHYYGPTLALYTA
jgi:hypothetical protein